MSGLAIRCPYSRVGPVTTTRCGITEDDARAHRHELVGEEQPALEHLLEHEHGATRLCRDDDRDRREVGRELRPGAVLDLRDRPAEIVDDPELLSRRHVNRVGFQLDLDPQAPQHREHRPEIVADDPVDRDLSARDGCHADEAPDLDVLGPDRVLAPREPVDTRHVEDVRADTLDLRATRDEGPAQVLHVRLAGGVRDHRLARRERRGHDRVLRRHHGGLVQVDVRSLERARELVALAELERRTELLERVEVRVEPAPADHVASRRRHDGAADSPEQRPGEEERRSDVARELGVDLVADVGGVHAYGVRVDPLHLGAEMGEQRAHRLDIADARDVVQRHRLVGEQARRQDRESAVLVP